VLGHSPSHKLWLELYLLRQLLDLDGYNLRISLEENSAILSGRKISEKQNNPQEIKD